jgi:N-acetylglucosaminyldiphosphoundecaprenol N-acetyl-beta-D-mannosaminyltransferase
MSACIEQAATVRWQRHLHLTKRVWRNRSAGVMSALSAGALLVATAPFLLLARAFGARIERARRTGRMGRAFTEYTLVRRNGRLLPVAGNWPKLFNLMRGDVSWVGPEPKCPADLDLKAEGARRIASVSPGLVCTWRVRKRTNVAYTSQSETDIQYVESHSISSDFGIVARAILSLAYGSARDQFPDVAEILGLPLDNLSLEHAAEEILRPSPRPRQVSFVNVDCVNRGFADREYRETLCRSDLRLADGIGLRIAGRLLSAEIRQNVNGTDLFPVLCDRMEKRGLRLFLLGGRPGVAADVAAWIAVRYPELAVAGTRDGYFRPEEEDAVIADINASGADILLVAFGAPLQEKWIKRQQHRLAVRSALGVGGLFDFYSGRIPRAPQWLRELGLEWTYRLYQEPGRMWRRYLVGNVSFLARVLMERAFGPRVTRPKTEQVKSI